MDITVGELLNKLHHRKKMVVRKDDIQFYKPPFSR